MEAKLKALKEVEQIYRLSKKWKRNMPDEKRPDFERMADTIFRRAMETPGRDDYMRVNVREGRHMHEHDERSARLIERTLKTGEYGPDALHSFQSGRVLTGRRRRRYPKPVRQPGDVRVRHVVQRRYRHCVPPRALAGLGLRAQHARARADAEPQAGGRAGRARRAAANRQHQDVLPMILRQKKECFPY